MQTFSRHLHTKVGDEQSQGDQCLEITFAVSAASTRSLSKRHGEVAMYSQLSRTERRNYYGNPNDPVYAQRLREQRDAYFSSRMGSNYPRIDYLRSDHPRSSWSQRPESQGPWDGEGQYRYYGGQGRVPTRGEPTGYGATGYGTTGYGAAEGYECYAERSRHSRSPDQFAGSGYYQYDTHYPRPTSRYERSGRPYPPHPASNSWSNAYAEPRGYRHGPYDYERFPRRETPAPAERGSNTGYPADRSRASYIYDGSRPSSRVSYSMTSSRTITPMNGVQGYQHSATAVQRWSEDRYYADAYARLDMHTGARGGVSNGRVGGLGKKVGGGSKATPKASRNLE
ncbi:hypothetical protein CERZMDRAFT_97557 [Cercospora zeae-maydis SCOH1-5]|uniref:Uncharacterized protein n=1 Tax=Cercospora zeae-maydis SCOH1-5 TaxID=717836 RepID=A0A6A6FFR4_9PEZI|nr:hypothetical protein CERZMDRAFT_97557 [Cercospora zeae-maydis SCOH1-5]